MFSDKLKNKMAKDYKKVYNLKAMIDCPIYCFNLSTDINNNVLLQDIYKFKELFPKSVHDYNNQRSNVNAWRSVYHTHKQTDILNNLLNLQNETVNKVFGECKVYVKSSWINFYSKGDSANRHSHSDNGWSTIYFPYVESNPTPVVFDNNNMPNIEKISIQPTNGMFLLFSSALFHHVPEIKENKRVSIATNLNILEKRETMTEEMLRNYENNV